MGVKGLTSDQSQTLKETILQRESSGNYQAENRLGYIGGYQMGAAALEDLGYLKKGTSASGNAALNNPNNWTIDGGKETFLNSPALQDQAFEKLANRNYNTLSKAGVINNNSSPGDIAGFVAASHLTGPGGAIKLANGQTAADANGVTASEYFALGKGRVNGTDTRPLSQISSSNKTGSSLAASTTKAASALPPAFTGNTGVGNTVNIGNTGFVGTESAEPLVNPLEQFVSFSSIFTLSCLTKKQYNFPDAVDSYKGNNLGKIILRSGGGQPSNRVSTAYSSSANPDGKFEYYIDNVEIESIMSFNKNTRGSNSNSISFEVLEPYSMGIFLQSMQIAAKECGYTNYIEAPFLLTIEFIGYDSDGNRVPANDRLDRHIPIKISNTDMKVSASGCKYAVTAYPYNEVALIDVNNLLKEDMNISGTNVAEILQSGKNSLQFWVNSSLEQIAKTSQANGQEKNTPDEIVIIFPKQMESASSQIASTTENAARLIKNPADQKSSGAIESKLTLNRGAHSLLAQDIGSLNEIGASSMGFNANTGGTGTQHGSNETKPDPAKPESRKSNYLNPKEGVFRFPQNTSIVSAIEEVLLMSNYCTSAIKTSDARGMKKWFRIETQTFILEAQQANREKSKEPKLLVFRIVPYYVHEHRISASTSEPKGYDQLKKSVAKTYEYIYTGKNVDVLDFNITLNSSFYTTVYADKSAANWAAYPQIGGESVEKTASPTTSTSSDIRQEPGIPTAPQGSQASREKRSGGGPHDTPQTLIAKNFQEALLNSPSDMLIAEMEIMGDPYFIADSGLGNFSDKPKNFNLNENGSMNYQSGEVDILINFRTPVDYNPQTGFADFGPTTLVEGFSGLYQLIQVKNKFSGGKFTQVLDLTRRPNQSPKDSTNVVATGINAIENISGAAQGAINSVIDQGKSVINSATGAVQGVMNNAKSAVQESAGKLLDTDSSKPLAVNPKQPEKTAVDSTSGGSTDSQFGFDIKSLIPGSWW